MEQDMKQITKERLKEWSACADGYRWFLEKFPQGGQYADVYTALVNDGRCDGAGWLADRAFALMCTVDQVSQTLAVTSAKVGSERPASVRTLRQGSTRPASRSACSCSSSTSWLTCNRTTPRCRARPR